MDAESNPYPNPAFVKWRKSDRLVKGWLRPPVLPYSETVTLLESYVERHNLDAQPAPQMVFYGQRSNKNIKNNGGQISFNSKGRGFAQGHQTTPKTFNSS